MKYQRIGKKNKYGGISWRIILYDIFSIYLHSNPKLETHVEIKEWKWFWNKTMLTYFSTKEMEDIISEAFEKLYLLYQKNDNCTFNKSALDKERDEVLSIYARNRKAEQEMQRKKSRQLEVFARKMEEEDDRSVNAIVSKLEYEIQESMYPYLEFSEWFNENFKVLQSTETTTIEDINCLRFTAMSEVAIGWFGVHEKIDFIILSKYLTKEYSGFYKQDGLSISEVPEFILFAVTKR